MTETTYTQSPWSLTDLFASQDSPEMRAALQGLETLVAGFETWRSELNAKISPASFMEAVRHLEHIQHVANRIYGFAFLSFAADTQDQIVQSFLAKMEQLLAEVQNRTLFFSLWWKDLDESEAQRLIAASGDYHYWLLLIRKFKPHTLSEPEEKIINIKDVTGSKALNTLYDAITNRYVFKLKVDGEVKELTRDALMVYVRQADPDLRARAYQELYRVFGQDAPILGQVYQTLVRDWHNEQLDLRYFASPIAARNLQNDLPDEVVSTLLEVCQRNASLFQRYFRLKARWLGMERLRRYDIYAPVDKSERIYSYGDAVEAVLNSFRRFDPLVAKLARHVLDENHLDSEVRLGKMDGAFCETIAPDLTPWVLVNYQGRAEDVATLAHELGHAIHSILAEQHSIFTQQSNLPLAETASTFGEMLLVDCLLAEENEITVRRDLLFRQVDDTYATIMRQAFFALFERRAHELIHQGLTIDELAEAYLENLQEQFGDAVQVSDEFRWEWVSILHIYHVPFYVYAYAFGQLLVLALYQQFKTEGETFKPRYLRLLAAGGSEAPVHLLTEAGIDVYREEFWQGGFNVIRGWIEQLESLPVSP